jgi:uncharacterized BrkB/YihY/UPF0761 family membrane protein
MTNTAEGVDRFQRRHLVIGFPLAVIYKFVEDQGSYLAAIISYYAFVAIFPLLLLASSILGFLLQGDPTLQAQLLDSALAQFPIVGTQLGRPEGLQGSTSAMVVGGVVALYGVLGLGQAGQNAMNVVWAVPRNSRPNPLLSRLRSLLLLALAGVAILLIASVGSLGSTVGTLGPEVGTGLRWALNVGVVLLNAAVLTVLFWLATPDRPSLVSTAPGALAVALMWQGLQFLGGLFVSRVISRVDAVNGTFALVLGLIGLIYVASLMAVLGIEINVLRARKLYPRALLTPFTDNVELTPADRHAYVDYAKAQRHKGFQRVRVTFDQPADEIESPEERAP